MSSHGTDRVARLAGIAGAALGIIAGTIQATLGSELPEWTGDKLHPVQLGILTVALSSSVLAAVVYLIGEPRARHARVAVAVVLAAVAGICFTTVGWLWLVPGPLLIVAAAAAFAGRPAAR